MAVPHPLLCESTAPTLLFFALLHTAVPLPHVAHSFILSGCHGPILLFFCVCEKEVPQRKRLERQSTAACSMFAPQLFVSHRFLRILLLRPSRPLPLGPKGTFRLLLFLVWETKKVRAPLSRLRHDIHLATAAFILSALDPLPSPSVVHSSNFRSLSSPSFRHKSQVICLGMPNKGKVQHKNRH